MNVKEWLVVHKYQMFLMLLEEQLKKILEVIDRPNKFVEASKIFKQLTLNKDLPSFLTTLAYDYI